MKPVDENDPVGGTPHAEIAAAVSELARRADERWVEVANDVLENAMLASRRSMPVRAHFGTDDVYVSEQVIITYLRRQIDEELQTAAVGRVFLTVDRDDELQAVTIELYAQFASPLFSLADRARAIADAVLVELLGFGRTPITVSTLHVHFSDVTAGDPHLHDPTDDD